MADDRLIGLADLGRIAAMLPQITAPQVVELSGWIAEIRAGARVQRDVPVPRVATVVPRPVDASTATVTVPEMPLIDSKPIATPAVEPSTSRAGAEWTEAECVRAMELFNAGWTMRQIATDLNRPYPATTQKLKRLRGVIAVPPRGVQGRGRFANPAVTAAAPVAQQDAGAGTPQQPGVDGVVAVSASPAGEIATTGDNVPAKMSTDNDPAPGASVDPAGAKGVAAPLAPAAPKLVTLDDAALRRLIALPPDFIPDDDLYLVEAMRDRNPLAQITDQLGCDVKTARARWQALIGAAGFDPSRRPDNAQLDALIAALLANVEAGRE